MPFASAAIPVELSFCSICAFPRKSAATPDFLCGLRVLCGEPSTTALTLSADAPAAFLLFCNQSCRQSAPGTPLPALPECHWSRSRGQPSRNSACPGDASAPPLRPTQSAAPNPCERRSPAARRAHGISSRTSPPGPCTARHPGETPGTPVVAVLRLWCPARSRRIPVSICLLAHFFFRLRRSRAMSAIPAI
jgi:hypothetical protein